MYLCVSTCTYLDLATCANLKCTCFCIRLFNLNLRYMSTSKQASKHTNIYSVDRGGEVGTMGNGGHECGCTITCPELNQSSVLWCTLFHSHTYVQVLYMHILCHQLYTILPYTRTHTHTHSISSCDTDDNRRTATPFSAACFQLLTVASFSSIRALFGFDHSLHF